MGWGRFSFNAPVLSALEIIGKFYTCANCIGDHWKFEKKESRIISESSTICIQKQRSRVWYSDWLISSINLHQKNFLFEHQCSSLAKNRKPHFCWGMCMARLQKRGTLKGRTMEHPFVTHQVLSIG